MSVPGYQVNWAKDVDIADLIIQNPDIYYSKPSCKEMASLAGYSGSTLQAIAPSVVNPGGDFFASPENHAQIDSTCWIWQNRDLTTP
ncbi:hypothetical protein BGZ57DRAFT_555208 [Hyaloscypha finlandica]|nr:hypothetical protein BGZ57DRAFT_555208 [Hyaloscypha finlandica]